MNAARFTALLLLVACAAMPARAVEASYQASIRTDVRVRTPVPGDRSRNWLTGDLEILPLLAGALRWSRTMLTVQLNPSLLFREPHLLGPVYPLAQGRVQLSTRGDRWQLLLSQDGAYGTQDIGSLRNPDGSRPTGVPEVQTLGAVPYVRSNSVVQFDDSPTARSSVHFVVGWLVQGSTNGSTQLPLQWGPNATIWYRHTLTRIDWLTTILQGTQATFATGQEQLIVMLTQGWDRQLTQSLLLSLAGGAALTRERIVDIPGGSNGIPGEYQELLPVVMANLGWRQHVGDQLVTAYANVRLAPFADRFTGAVYERLEARAQAQWLPAREWTLMAAGGLAWAVPVGRAEQAGDKIVFVEASASWAVLRWLTLMLYSRVAWVQQPRLQIDSQVQWVGTASIVLHDRDSAAW